METMQTRVYSLFNANGETMQELKPAPALPYGCKCFIYGYGMSGGIGAICSAPDNLGRYKVVKISDFEEFQGFTTLERYDRPHS